MTTDLQGRPTPSQWLAGARPRTLPAAVAPVLAGSAVPLSVAGWGPREGVAAWAFAASGLGATAGVTAAGSVIPSRVRCSV